MHNSAPIIGLKDINREFVSANGEVVRVLRDVNLDIERGSFNVIRGQSGSGKTTLLRILGMLDAGFAGSYQFEDASVSDQPDWYLDELRANNLGFIFQEGRLFGHLALRRNVELPLILHGSSDNASRTVNDLAPRFFSDEEIGKDTLGLKPGSASGGQGQRASIMRAIIDKPSIILADEPTASLHGSLKTEVVEHLKSLCARGHTVIVVSHDDAFYGFGRQLELNEGVLTEVTGTHEQAEAPIASRMPDAGGAIWYGWKPRAPLMVLLQQSLHETFLRPLFLLLILAALVVGVTQVSVFSSIILGAQAFVNEKITQGSRLNRIQIKPRKKDRGEKDRFPLRTEIAGFDDVDVVVERRATTTRIVALDGDPKTYSVSGLHLNDPEYGLLQFLAGGPFSDSHDQPEVILTAGLLGDVFGTDRLEAGEAGYADFIGKTVVATINRYNTAGDFVSEIPVTLRVKGIISHGEGGRQLYYPNRTLLLFDSLTRDRTLTRTLPENAGVDNWLTADDIAVRTDFPWEDNLHIYANDIQRVLPLYTQLSKLGYRPKSDIWDYKWALDIQDTAWRIFRPMLGLIVLAVSITVVANILISARLRVTELALWRVLGMRRGDLVLTQVVSLFMSVFIGTMLGLALGGIAISQTKQMLAARSAETAAASGEATQNFDALFAPLSDFYGLIVISALALGTAVSLYPAIRTARTDPAKVLKG